MKNINPLFHENDNPVEGLKKIEFILCFLKEIHGQGQNEYEISENGKNGLFLIIDFLEDATRLIGDSLQKK